MACEIIGSSLFDRYIEKENPLIIDLRSETDYMKKHIKGAVCINAEDLENAIENYMYGRTGIVRTGDVLLKKIRLFCYIAAEEHKAILCAEKCQWQVLMLSL